MQWKKLLPSVTPFFGKLVTCIVAEVGGKQGTTWDEVTFNSVTIKPISIANYCDKESVSNGT